MLRRSFFHGLVGGVLGSGAVAEAVSAATENVRQDKRTIPAPFVPIVDYMAAEQIADLEKGGGAIDVSDAWQRAFDSITNGQILLVTPGRHLLRQPVKMQGKRNVTLLAHGAVVCEGQNQKGSLISFFQCNNLRIDNLVYEGVESYETFSSDQPGDRRFVLWAEECNNLRIADSLFSKKRGFIRLERCRRASISGCDFVGFFQDIEKGIQKSGNECPAIEIRGGTFHRIISCSATNHGSCVLIGGDSAGNLVFGCSAQNMHDNAIYISSGSRNRVFGVDGIDIGAQLVKMRGTQNLVFGSSAQNSKGMAVTGNGSRQDSSGANGSGNIVFGNTLQKTRGADAINFGGHDGYQQRDLIVAFNVADGVSANGGNAGIRGGVVKNAIIAGNILTDMSTDYGVLYSGNANNPTSGMAVVMNVVSESPQSTSVQIQNADSPMLALNLNSKTKKGFTTKNTKEPFLLGNRLDGKPDGLGGESSSLNDVSQPRLQVPSVANSIRQKPSAIGQLAVVGGTAYVATGLDASAWKKITE